MVVYREDMNQKKYFVPIIAFLALAGCGQATGPKGQPFVPARASIPAATSTAPTAPIVIPAQAGIQGVQSADFISPISTPASRITKKPFGIYITKQTSPVQPERFGGFHVGVDFETTSAEKDIVVPISAACDGKLLLKKRATGYGGVAVQSCRIDGKDVTIVYGHLRLSSVTLTVGQAIKQGDQIGVLGTGYSTETDGERKHLHLGIHKGTTVDIKGYEQSKSALSQWLDAKAILGL